jgi:hypothetical protein
VSADPSRREALIRDIAILQVRAQLERARPRLTFARDLAMRSAERRPDRRVDSLEHAYSRAVALVQGLSSVLDDLGRHLGGGR